MASKLVPCRLCKKEISSKADVCPHCGEKKPVVVKVSAFGKIIGVSIWGTIGLFIFIAIFGPENSSTPTSSQAEAKTEEQIYQENCRQSWNKCKNNADIINFNTAMDAEMKLKCKWAAEKQSKYEIDWGWGKFGFYNSGDTALTNGTIILVDDTAKYKNAFGGEVKTKTSCLFNLKTMTAEKISTD
jgi:hypothetical protein